MARPTMNTTGKPWSVTQVALGAKISMRTARTLVESQWIPSKTLTGDHVLIARVAAALLDAPRPEGVSRSGADASTHDRNRQLLDRAYALLSEPNPAAVALISPNEVYVAETNFKAMAFLEDQPGNEAILLLPVGRWAKEVLDGR